MKENAFKSKNVLITGGVGFIGSNLALALVELGANVTLVDSLIPEYGGNLWNIEPVKDKVNVNISDVRDEHSMKYLVKNQDYLFNLAGQTSHTDSMSDPYTDLEKPGTDVAVFSAMAHVILREKLYNRKFIDERTENFDRFADIIKDFCTHIGQTIKSASKLSKMMAGKLAGN